MIVKKLLSVALLLAATGTAFVASEQSAEAARCCRQRCHRNHRCCGNTGYGYGGSSGCNTCNMAPGTSQGSSSVPAPATDAPAPPPAPST
jgi:hypothetical protein